MTADVYVAGQIERALHSDPRTHELGVLVEVDGDAIVLRGEVASGERRLHVAEVAAEQAPDLVLRNEVQVTPVQSPEAPEVLPTPEEAAPVRDVLPPRERS